MRKNSGDKNQEKFSKTSINWFPGHMAKARRQISESCKQVDMIVEILDARAPLSSRNPDIKSLILQKPHVVILNKSDLSDGVQTRNWVEYFKNQDIPCISFSIKDKDCIKTFRKQIKKVMQPKLLHWKSRGMIGRNIKFMIVGIPNVGKSAIINRLIGNSKAKVQNKPGVTRKNQWFSVGDDLQILDTPGILWPRFDDDKTAVNLALLGSIKDQILDIEDLAIKFLDLVKGSYSNNVCKRYGINEDEFSDLKGTEYLESIAKRRGMVIPGGQLDISRCAKMIVDEFRTGKLGKITLERIGEQ